MSDWADDEGQRIADYLDPGACQSDYDTIASALRAAEKRGRVAGLREAGDKTEEMVATFDYPSVYMGGASHAAKRTAKYVADVFRAAADKLEAEKP